MNTQLFESLDKGNTTGFATEDLVKIVEADQAGDWEELTLEEMLAEMDAMEVEHNAKRSI